MNKMTREITSQIIAWTIILFTVYCIYVIISAMI